MINSLAKKRAGLYASRAFECNLAFVFFFFFFVFFSLSWCRGSAADCDCDTPCHISCSPLRHHSDQKYRQSMRCICFFLQIVINEKESVTSNLEA